MARSNRRRNPLSGWRGFSFVAAVAIAVTGGCASDDAPVAGSTTDSPAPESSVKSTIEPSATDPVGNTPSTAPATSTDDVAMSPLADALPPISGSNAVRFRVPSPDWLAADDSFVYVKLDRGAVVRLDPANGDQLAEIELNHDLCQGIGAGFGSVWACSGTGVARIDPTTDTVTATIAVNKTFTQGHLATGFDAVWVLIDDGSQLVAIDPASNEYSTPIDLGARGTDVAVGTDHVWIVSTVDDAVMRVDPTSMTVEGTITVTDPGSVVVSDGVWVGTASGILRFDEESLTVLQEIADVPAGPESALATRGADLFVRDRDPFLVHVDTADGAVVQRVTEDVRSSGDMLVAFDAIWTTAYDDAALFRIPLD
jgi:hypothetical protein